MTECKLSLVKKITNSASPHHRTLKKSDNLNSIERLQKNDKIKIPLKFDNLLSKETKLGEVDNVIPD